MVSCLYQFDSYRRFLLLIVLIRVPLLGLVFVCTTLLTLILFHYGKLTRLYLQCTLFSFESLFQEVPRIDPVSDIPQTTEPIQNSVVVERRKPVLQSCIWKLQREYYESLTSDAAVAKSSSFSISSNCYVARVLSVYVFHQ